jgi:hypothetical protein
MRTNSKVLFNLKIILSLFLKNGKLIELHYEIRYNRWCVSYIWLEEANNEL